ncbi:MAG: type II secretion system protein [Rhizomicrobium sp.]
MNSGRRADGFTLVELLVSLAILAVALSVLFGAVSSALDRTRKDRNDALASSLVQSLLERAGGDRPLRADGGRLFERHALASGRDALR